LNVREAFTIFSSSFPKRVGEPFTPNKMRVEILAAALLTSIVDSASSVSGSTCKCFPGDACWPVQEQWDHLNSTVGGRLIATAPLGSPCHDPNYDVEACRLLQEQWLYSGVQYVPQNPWKWSR
jgi:hypothetical protein